MSCQVGQINRDLVWDFWQLGHPFVPPPLPPSLQETASITVEAGGAKPCPYAFLSPCPSLSSVLQPPGLEASAGAHGTCGAGVVPSPALAPQAPLCHLPFAMAKFTLLYTEAILWVIPASPRAGFGLDCLHSLFI